jgi:hypothetical protein
LTKQIGDPNKASERDVSFDRGEESGIDLAMILAGLTAVSAYVNSVGDLPNANVAEAFEAGLRAALRLRLKVNLDGDKQSRCRLS